MSKWTAQDWAGWRAENARLLSEGWQIHTAQKLDGAVETYALKDGVRIDRSPQWDRDEDGNYVYGAP